MADKKPLVNSAGNAVEIATGDTIPVANGGTGQSTLTDNGVLIGNGTGAIDVTSAGTTGKVLSGVTGGNPTFQRWCQSAGKSADESVSSSTTYQDDDHLKFYVEANEIWNFFVNMRATANVSGGMKIRLTVPSGATATGLAQLTGVFTNTNVDLTSGFGGTVAIATTNLGGFSGRVVNSSTAGWVQVQFAQNASFATNTTMMKSTTLLAIRES